MNSSFNVEENETSVCLRPNYTYIKYDVGEIVIYSILGSLFCLLAFVGNCLVVAVIIKDPVINTHKHNLYLLSLAVADALLAVTVFPFSLSSELLGKWPFNPTYCRIYLSIDIALCTASIWSIAFIGLDRFASVKFPILCRQYKTTKKIKLLIAAIWGYSVFVSLVPYFSRTNLISKESDKCFINNAQWVSLFRFGFAVFFLALHQWLSVSSLHPIFKVLTQKKTSKFIILSTALSFFVPASVIGPVYIGIFIIGRRVGSRSTKFQSEMKSNCNNSQRPSSQRSPGDHSDSGVEVEKRRSIGQLKLSFFKKMDIPMKKHNELEIKEDADSGTESHRSNSPSPVGSLGRNCCPPPNGSSKNSPAKNRSPSPSGSPRFLTPSPHGSPGKMLCSPSLRKERHLDGTTCDVQPECQRLSSEKLAVTKSGATDQGSFKRFFETVYKSFHLPRNSNSFKDPGIQIEIEPNTTSQDTHTRKSVGETPTCSRKFELRKSSTAPRAKISRRERRFIVIILLVTGLFILCWSPFFVTYLIYGICREACCIHVRFFKFVFYLGYLNSGVNPIIYTIFNKDFKLAFKKLLHWT